MVSRRPIPIQFNICDRLIDMFQVIENVRTIIGFLYCFNWFFNQIIIKYIILYFT